jgi:hypothetical protein
MKKLFNNPWKVFAIGVILSSCIFFLIPINLFDGEIVFKEGLMEWKEKANISLSYFIHIGAQKEELARIGVKDFYLLPKGYVFAGIVLVGIPALIAYRSYLKKKKDDDNDSIKMKINTKENRKVESSHFDESGIGTQF